MTRPSPELQPLPFHYLSLVKDEYKSLISKVTATAHAAGYALLHEAHGYDVLANLDEVKRLLKAENSLVELPLHTAARLMQDAEVGASCKAIASPYTFTADAAKIVLYYCGDNPLEVSALVCTSRDSIATHLFRDYALRKGWNLDKIDENTQEVWEYDNVLLHADFENALIPEGRFWNRAFLISGTRRIQAMERLLNRENLPRRLKLHRLTDDIYRTVKDGWRASLGNLDRALPDLPGTIIVARPALAEAPFIPPLIDAISAWNADSGTLLEAANMGTPHVGTPISIVAIVVYMELLARHALQQRHERLPTLDYAHFLLSEKSAHWDAEREEVVRAVELGAEWLFKGRLEFVSETLDLRSYCRAPASGGVSPASALAIFDREQLAPLARCVEELRTLADERTTAAKALRGKVDEVFTLLVRAKGAFRGVDPGTRTPQGIPEARFHAFELPYRGTLVGVRVWTDRWRPSYRDRIDQLIHNNAERLQALSSAASVICQHRRVLNDSLKESFGAGMDDDTFTQFLFNLRLLFPFIETKRSRQVYSSDRAKEVVHQADLPALEALHTRAAPAD